MNFKGVPIPCLFLFGKIVCCNFGLIPGAMTPTKENPGVISLLNAFSKFTYLYRTISESEPHSVLR